MDFENDEMYTYPITDNITILYSLSVDKWAIETLDDSFSVDEYSFEEPIVIDETSICFKDFKKAQDIILKRM